MSSIEVLSPTTKHLNDGIFSSIKRPNNLLKSHPHKKGQFKMSDEAYHSHDKEPNALNASELINLK